MALERRSSVTTPLGDDALLLQSITGYEELGRPFRFDLDLLSEEDNVKPADVLGKTMTVNIELPDGTSKRYLHGHCVRFARVARRGQFIVHHATLRPWLWLLTRATNCRIFQNKTVPDIIQKVFRDQGLTDFEVHLTQTYSAREYVVQFRESDFDFVSRLMEEVGIYYYFQHTADKHTLVLVDDVASHSPMPDYDTVPYRPPGQRDLEHIDHWSNYVEVRSGGYTIDDYKFQTPKATLLADRSAPKDNEWGTLLRYEYPGGYQETADGKNLVRVRLEEHQADYEIFEGEAACRGLAAGHTFTLSDYPRDDQNKTYLVVSSTYHVATEHYASGGSADAQEFRCSVTAIDAQQPFRSARTTPRPRIGPQTAKVVGHAGEEIWTDEFGRVRLDFHWDREGKHNETSSCWVRVAQIWAGGGFGAQFIPRIGMEVVVDFLDGNPDRPLVVGCVYNGFNKLPFPLPKNQTQSGIKTQSTKGGNGSNFNEIRFEDDKGKEDLLIKAQNTQTTTVNGAQTITVGGTRNIHVKKDDTETFDEGRVVTVGKKKDQLFANNGRDVTVGTLDHTSVDGDKETEVKGNYKITTTATGEITITSAAKVSITAPMVEIVGNTTIKLNSP